MTPDPRCVCGAPLWRTFAECGEVHEGPSHDRPTRPQCAGHERERDEK